MDTILANGVKRGVKAPGDTPLLYVLKNDLELSGPQFGCGLAQCGACSVLLNGKEVRSRASHLCPPWAIKSSQHSRASRRDGPNNAH